MITFDHVGKENTPAVLEIAVARAMQMNTDLVISSGSGDTAMELVKTAEEMGFQGKIVVVRSCSSAALNGVNKMAPERKAELQAKGAAVVSAAHALSAGERSVSGTFKGQYPLEIMAAALRMLGQGTKVAVEISVMALDADEIPYGRPVVAMGGSSHGVDTAAVITPSYSSTILQTKVHEILCKPGLYEG